MTPTPPLFPPYPIRGVCVLHKKQNCAPHFAGIEVDFEPAAEGFAFEVARDGTALAAARLVVEQIPAQAWCGPCAEEFAVGTPPFFWCPRCDQPSTDLRSGRELEITGIEPSPAPA